MGGRSITVGCVVSFVIRACKYTTIWVYYKIQRKLSSGVAGFGTVVYPQASSMIHSCCMEKNANIHNSERIYLDYAATTPVRPEVDKAMQKVRKHLGHPWSRHEHGRRVQSKLSAARRRISEGIGGPERPTDRDVVITSGATESNTLALLGRITHLKNKDPGREIRVAISAIEHPSVARLREYFDSRNGVVVDVLPVMKEGRVDISHLRKALRPETALVSVMYVNSEIGTIQPIASIAHEIRVFNSEHNLNNDERVLFHTDASQAPLWCEVDVNKLGVDMLTLDGHKMYGPTGVGLLWVRRGIDLAPIFLSSRLDGEKLRGGTPSLPLAEGLATSLEYANRGREARVHQIRPLRDDLIKQLTDAHDCRINGSVEHRVAGNVSVSFTDVNHEFLQAQLDERGISTATRSACLEIGGEGSSVIAAINPDQKSALRVTLGEETTQEEIDVFLSALSELL